MFNPQSPSPSTPQLNPAVLAALASLLNGGQQMMPGHLPEQPQPGLPQGLSPLAQAAAGNDPAGGYQPPAGQIGQVAAGRPPFQPGAGAASVQPLMQLLSRFRQTHPGLRVG